MMEIQVTAEDIQNGIKSSHCSCPIALALKRTFPSSNISVAKNILINKISFKHNGGEFIHKFDIGIIGEPFILTIEEDKG